MIDRLPQPRSHADCQSKFPWRKEGRLYNIRRMRGRQLGSWLITLFLPAFLIASDKPVGPYGVPDDDAVVKATRLIKQTFAQEYVAATTLPQRATLARRLLKEAVETHEGIPAREPPLREARGLAAKSAGAPTPRRAHLLLS